MWNCIGMQGPVVPLPGMTISIHYYLMRRNEISSAPAFLATKPNRQTNLDASKSTRQPVIALHLLSLSTYRL